MYFPSVAPSSLAQEDVGVWAPVDHQRVIAKLMTGLGILFYRQKAISLEPLPETMLDEGEASQVPDLSLCDNNIDGFEQLSISAATSRLQHSPHQLLL